MTTKSSNRKSDSMSPMRFIVATLLCLITLGALGVAGYSRFMAQQAKSLASPQKARLAGQPMPVRSEIIHEASYEQVIGATAITEASQEAIIRFAGAGDPSGQRLVVKRVLVKEGQMVEEGDVLFEVDRETLELVFKQMKAVEAGAAAEYEGIKRLYEREAASKFELSSSEIELESAKLDSEMARRNLEASRVLSPINGQLDSVYAVAGESLDAAAELTTVYRLDPIHVRVEVPQERVVEVVRGASTEVVIDSFPHDVFQGVVISISPQVDPDTRVLSVVVEVPNSDQRIKAGMSGFARFRDEKRALIVPDSAIVELNGKASVFVVEEGRARLREVRTGALVEVGRRIVDVGLSAEDEVIVYGQQTLEDNDLVDTDWRKWTRRELASESQDDQADMANAENDSSTDRQ